MRTPARARPRAQAERVAVGMQVAAVGVVDAAGVALARRRCVRSSSWLDEAQRVVVVFRVQRLDFRAQRVVMTAPSGRRSCVRPRSRSRWNAAR